VAAMTRREIVYKALAHEETERLPYRIEFAGDTAERLRAHLGVEDLEEAVGNYVRAVGPPWWGFTEPPPEFRGDAVPAELPPVQGRRGFDSFAETIQRLRAETDCYILAVIYAFNFEKAWMLRSMPQFMMDLVRAPEFIEKLLGKIMEINLAMLQLLVSFEEVDGFMLGSDWGGQQGLLISPEHWRRFIKPTEAACYKIVRDAGKHLWVHSCGKIEVVIPDLIESGLQALNPVQSEVMDVRALKADFGRDLTFWGGIGTQRVLPYGTPDQVRADVERTIEIMAPGGGYVLGPSQGIQEDVPIENVLALIDAAKAHG